MTSQWAPLRLKLHASWLFVQSFVQAHIKENIKTPPHWPFWGNPPVTGGFSSQRASNAEKVSICWRYHMVLLNRCWSRGMAETSWSTKNLGLCHVITCPCIPWNTWWRHQMETSKLRVTGHLCGEFTGARWIPHTKASDVELWCFL